VVLAAALSVGARPRMTCRMQAVTAWWPLADNAQDVSNGGDTCDVRVDWQTAVAIGDTLAVSTDDGFDEGWVEAFRVVLDEHEREAAARSWSEIDFDYADEGAFRLLVREIEPEAGPSELRQALEGVVEAANRAARVGTHVYDLARELRRPQPEAQRESVPPPSLDPLADELDADAA
jgi:hypothetical protein